MAEDESGFSLVELLVVIVIISILAAIAIPIFLAQRERAWHAQSESALKNAATAMEAAAVSNNGVYGGVSTTDLVNDQGLKYASAVLDLTVESANDTGFCLSVLHERSNEILYWDSAIGRPSSTDCSTKYP